MWRLSNMLLNNYWVNEEIKEETPKYLKASENTAYQNLWDAVKAMLRGKFTRLNAYLSKEERSKINKLSFHLRKLEKGINSIQTKQKRKIKMRAEINEIENRKPLEKIRKTKSWFFEKINKIHKPPAKLIKIY